MLPSADVSGALTFRSWTSLLWYQGRYLKEKNYSPFLSGSFAGILSWLTSYPLDTIRSRQISQNINISQAFKIGKLYKGITPCLVRAVLTNGCIWTIVEKMNK